MSTEPRAENLQLSTQEETKVGNYFVSNYPPFSSWTKDAVPKVHGRLDRDEPADRPLGLYVHIPFCRKRCDFCYFRVYTDKDSKAIRRYLDALLAEMEMYADRAAIENRKLSFVYFGGGTPSYLSVEQLGYLFDGLQSRLHWNDVEEITFECEPGTLQEKKIYALRSMGVTRLSLGVENFDPQILELNNRAHRAKEIYKAYEIAPKVGFSQINIDLIAGMVGETEENWQSCIQKAREMSAESVTVYQMEVPYNTTVYQRMKDGGQEIAPVADWQTKRRWVNEAFEALEADGYTIGSAYTAVKDPQVKFRYRDALWTGADMLGLGVASFSHLAGVHFQNEHNFEPYIEAVEAGRLPIHRALELSQDERLIREFILQLKLGEIDLAYFKNKFGVDPRERFKEALARHQASGVMSIEGDKLRLSRSGLLQVDPMLYDFFLDEHRAARYA
ncbi:MAG: coproporphyrinogen-III oxidase family protein [Planctomycetota bacterium]|jgi:oxygen-independent coproporphyrinogen-3 oxidase